MNYLSVCSGIEAATQAWRPLGFHAVAFSEIEPFPCAVLAHHYPTTPNMGDMTKHETWKLDASVDLLVGGTPCQSFSVAGLRKGLADPRGNLALTFLAIVDQYRPKWVLWENVPGVLSDQSNAFGCFLGGLAELGYGWVYRILDAQYFGVAQRRRRVFVVGHLGNWAAAAAVLFERESLCWNPAPERKAGQRIAGTLKVGSGERGYPDPGDGNGGGLVEIPALAKGVRTPTGGIDREDMHTLIPAIAPPLMSGSHNKTAHNAQSGISKDACLIPELARTLNSRHDSSACADRGMDVIPEVCGTLSDGAHQGGGA